MRNRSLETPENQHRNGSDGGDAWLVPALQELLKAFEYAQRGHHLIWDFAVESQTLRSLGFTEADFRWLASAGYVDHARELSSLGDDHRQFQRTGKLLFTRRSCFVLTESGARFATSLLHSDFATAPESLTPSARSQPNGEHTQPVWDSQRRELLIGKTLVKQFKWAAMNQEMILAVFQEMGWPPRIDDPLSPQPEQDPKRRLHDTIKCLNRNQKRRLIRFYGDGTGEGVLWRFID